MKKNIVKSIIQSKRGFKAEKLIFLDGYFPISEAHLCSCRLDILEVSFTDTILMEYKVINGKTYKENKTGIREIKKR